MTLSSIGFGHNPFGHHGWGLGDWAEEMLWRNMPQVYKDCDESGPVGSAVAQPLRKFQEALKPSYQDIRVKWLQFPYLWDAIRVPLDQLAQLGYNVGIIDDSTKSDGLRRSSVLNASQLWLSKGTDKGYEITAAFEGLLVTVTPLWAQTCGPARQVLGLITGSVPCEFNLASTVITERPISPGTVHITVTTQYGILEDIRDDSLGNLVGYGNQQNGELTRIELTSVTTLRLVSIVGIFSVGDTVTQGLTSGIVVAVTGAAVTINTTAGVFTTGAVVDTTSGATGSVANIASDVIEAGETFRGLLSGATAVMRDFNNTYGVIDRISSLAGFTPGETLLGLTSGDYALAGASTPLVQGPLQSRLDLSSITGAFTVDEEITGGTSGSIGIVRGVTSTAVFVDTTTTPGFVAGETVTTAGGSATVDLVDFGQVDYIGGALSGVTTCLQLNSSVDYVVDLTSEGPSSFVANYDEVSADLLPMDTILEDRYDRWPVTAPPVRISGGIISPGACRSHSLRLHFTTPDNTEIENFVDVAGRITASLERFRPIHVEFDKISFDGSRASSQIWYTGQVNADSSASAVWYASVVGEQRASSQVWTTGPFSATVAS